MDTGIQFLNIFPDVFGIEESDDPTIEVALTLTLLRTVSFPTTQTSVINNDLENEGRKKKNQVFLE